MFIVRHLKLYGGYETLDVANSLISDAVPRILEVQDALSKLTAVDREKDY